STLRSCGTEYASRDSRAIDAPGFSGTIVGNKPGGSALKPAPFGYAKATSVDHAVALLSQYADGRLLACGQSLIATLKLRLSAPRLLIDINALDELKSISRDGDTLSIGALVRHAEAERSDEIARHAPLIALAMPHIAHPAIRNRGTIGGSIAFADPAAELPACLLALRGEVGVAQTRRHAPGRGGRLLQGPVRAGTGAGRCADRSSHPSRARGEPLRLRGAGAPARRLRAGRARGRGARRRQGAARRPPRLLRRWRDAAASAQRRSRGRTRRRPGRGARARPCAAGRRAGLGRNAQAPRRRADATGRDAARGAASMTERFHDIALTVNGEEV